MNSVSKYEQDINVISFYNNKTDLYFIDLCGYKCNWFSNTYLLEYKYNWKGLCNVAFPEVYRIIKKHRRVECYNYKLANKSNNFIKFTPYHLLSGKQIISKKTPYIISSNHVKNNNELIVKTITLQDLLDKQNVPKTIYYLSLDNGGNELEILKSFDFSKYTILYINIDHNFKESKKKEINNFLCNNGYLHKEENNFYHNYIHENTLIGTYYYNEDYTKPIIIKKQDKNNFIVTSSYWDDDIGIFSNGFINWKSNGKGKIFFTHIDYGNGNMWHRDKRK